MKTLFAFLCLVLNGCSVGPSVPKGQSTIQGRGSEALTNQGDPLMQTGKYDRRVPVDFAQGYAKGISDQVKRTYWAQQDSQRSSTEEAEGKIHYYHSSIPEHEENSGIIRVQHDEIIPIAE